MSVYPPPTANPIFNKSNFPNNELLFVLDGLTASARAYIDQKIADLSGTLDLSFILQNGNSAGIYDIDMSLNDILQVSNIDVVTINGNAYPPSVPSDTLQDVLDAGNTANDVSIILNDTTPSTQTTTLSSGGMNITKTDEFGVVSDGNIFFNNTDLTISTNENLVLTADNIDLNNAGTLIVPSLANNYLRYNPTTANELLYSKSANAGGGFPMLSLLQDNTANGSANLRFQKNTTVVGSPLGELAFYGRDATAGNPYREFARIRTAIRNNTAPSNIDGSIDFFTLVNGSLTELMRINGQNSEIEFYQPLDLNSNAIKTATGNIELNATASSGTGDILLTPKGNVRVSEDILTDSKIANPDLISSSIDFADSTPDQRFTIDRDKIELHYNNLITQSTQQIIHDNTTEEAYFKQTFTDSVSNTNETLIKNDVNNHSIKLYQTTGNLSSEITKTSLVITDGIGKTININNTANGNIVYDNTADTNPLIITSTNTQLTLQTSGTTAGSGNIEFAPSQNGTANGQIVFTGASLQSNTAGGNSGEHLVITLNGVPYKIKLELP